LKSLRLFHEVTSWLPAATAGDGSTFHVQLLRRLDSHFTLDKLLTYVGSVNS